MQPIYDSLAIPNSSVTSLDRQFTQPVSAVSQGLLPLKEFIYTFIQTELLRGKSPEAIENNIKFRNARSNKVVQEIEDMKSMSTEELEKHKNLLEDARESAWQERHNELISRKGHLQRVLEQAEKLNSPSEDFDAFFLHFKNKLRFAVYIVDEHILSDPKPQREECLQTWYKNRVDGLEASKREHDRVTVTEVNSLRDMEEWQQALRETLDEQIGPDLPLVKDPNEPRE